MYLVTWCWQQHTEKCLWDVPYRDTMPRERIRLPMDILPIWLAAASAVAAPSDYSMDAVEVYLGAGLP